MKGTAVLVHYALGVGIVAISFGSILARIAGAPAATVAALRMVFSVFILLPFALALSRNGAGRPESSRRDRALLVLAGLFLALHFFLWISSLSFTGVTSSVVFVTTSPLWVALYGILFLRKKVSRIFWLGLCLSLLGGAIIGGRDAVTEGLRWRGDILAVGGAVAIAGYFVVGSGLRERFSLISYVFPVYACAAALLSTAAMLTGSPLMGWGWRVYGACFAMALVCQVAGHSLFNWALKHLDAEAVAMAALGEPVGASLLALLILGERASPSEIAGGAAILAGIVLVLRFSPEASKVKDGLGSRG